jgi:hypothetical protein
MYIAMGHDIEAQEQDEGLLLSAFDHCKLLHRELILLSP